MFNWILIFYTVLLCLIILLAIYVFAFYTFKKNVRVENEKLARKLYEEGPLQDLLNGSGINNIPKLNLITTNPSVAQANNCANGPVYVRSDVDTMPITDSECIRICVNASGKAINVVDNETYIYESTALNVGAYCTIGPRPRCNMKTTYSLMTINSVVCQSKYPNMVGGPLGNNVVACNNSQINDPRNVLWDYRENRRFSPVTTVFGGDEDEIFQGNYRFRCKFDGLDRRGNKYIENPLGRFHPIENYCAALIYRAHLDVRTDFLYDDDNSNKVTDFRCLCGNVTETRVSNIDPNNPRSQCSTISLSLTQDVKDREKLTIPYRCFTLFSTISDVGKYLPCPNEQFTREGNQIAAVDLKIASIIDPVIEHPAYERLSTTASVGVNHINVGG